MEVFEDMPCLALSESDSVMSDQEQIINSWLADADVCNLLNDDAPLLELQGVPSTSPEYFYLDPHGSPDSPPSYTSTPELPELEGSFITVDTPPLFGDQVDAVLFGTSFTVNPDVLPELERILATVECISSPESSAPQSPASPVDETQEKRYSKKRKGDDGKEVKGSDILLPRDQLLVMTSVEIETYVAGLKSRRNLTAAEEKELKRQRRLVKNREYASQSRSRKKQFVDELEKTIETLRSENSALKQQVGTLSEENKSLKKKISSIATTIKKSSSSLSNSSSGMLTRLTTVGKPNASKTVGACLLAMMFMVISVGMLGDNQHKFLIFPASEHGDVYVRTGAPRVLLGEDAPEVAPPPMHRSTHRGPPPLVPKTPSTSTFTPTATTTMEPTTTTTTTPTTVTTKTRAKFTMCADILPNDATSNFTMNAFFKNIPPCTSSAVYVS